MEDVSIVLIIVVVRAQHGLWGGVECREILWRYEWFCLGVR